MSASEEIYRKVARVLAESLNVDEDDLAPTATLQGDLGAESIDFLDIVFRLEREFGIKIPRGELFPESLFQGDPDFVREGRATDQGMDELRSRMPYADLGAFDKDRRLSVVTDLFTVGLVTRYIAWKLGQSAGAGPNGSNGTGAISATCRASSTHRE
jgi:acyl carrier protein